MADGETIFLFTILHDNPRRLKMDVKCESCDETMFQTGITNTGAILVTSDAVPETVSVENKEYIKCPYCNALHVFIETESKVGGSELKILGLKQP